MMTATWIDVATGYAPAVSSGRVRLDAAAQSASLDTDGQMTVDDARSVIGRYVASRRAR